MNYFYLFVINIKVLNDSLIYYNYNKNKRSNEDYNIRNEIEKLLENGVLQRDDIIKLNNLKNVRDYFIHQKEIPSILMGTENSYLKIIKSAKLELLEKEDIKEGLEILLRMLKKRNVLMF